MNKKDTVCAVVVTYNRKELLLNCLEGIRRQTRPPDAVIIIDNASTDGTQQVLQENFPNINDTKSVISCIKMETNTGGSGGFHEGVKRGFEGGYDWLWLMDDDVVPLDDCLERLIEDASGRDKDFSAFQCLRRGLDGAMIDWYPYFSRLSLRAGNSYPGKSNTLCFEGTFIGRAVVQKVGFPDARFFFTLDDTEYGLRLSEIAPIRYVKAAILARQLPEATRHALIKRYYYFRNLFLLSSLRGIPMGRATFIILLQTCGSMLKTLFFERQKFKTIYTLAKAYCDGLKGRYGKTI